MLREVGRLKEPYVSPFCLDFVLGTINGCFKQAYGNIKGGMSKDGKR